MGNLWPSNSAIENRIGVRMYWVEEIQPWATRGKPTALSKKGPRFFSKAGLGHGGEGGDGRVAKRKRLKEMPFNAGNRSSLIAGELGRELRPVPLYLKAIFRFLSFPGQIIRGLGATLSGLLRTPQGLQGRCR